MIGATDAAGAAFTHAETGTAEQVWLEEFARRERVGAAPAELDLASATSLVVLAAHPDDETLGAAGLLHEATRLGLPVTIVVATAGEASHPHSPTVTPDDLAARRRAESRAAALDVAPEARVLFAGIPDGRLTAFEHELMRLLEPLIAPGTLLAAPWRDDRHPDHAAAARVALGLGARVGARVLEYPVWLWHWGAPEDLPTAGLRTLPLDPVARAAKRSALSRHRSQTNPLSPEPGDEALLHPGFLAHFDRPAEIFVETPSAAAAVSTPDAAAARFDAMLELDSDPWGVETRWYERRKRAVLLAALPAERFAAVLELGCSTGVLSAALADRSGALLGVDVSARAVELARARLGEHTSAQFAVSAVPEEWPAGRFDLIVASELVYYLPAPRRSQLIERMLGALSPGGWIVVCHWRHAMHDSEIDGDTATAEFAVHPALDTVARHEETDFTLLVFARRPAVSVAQAEGITP